jgi:UbiD family decarboxylase
MAKDLRGFLDELRTAGGDELVEIDAPVRPDAFEVTAVLKQFEDRRRHPAVLFRRPTDVDGRPSAFPLVSNLYATRARCARMIGADPTRPNWDLSRAFAAAAKARIEPVTIDAAAAPVRRNVWTGDEADVARLPIVRHFAMDLGPTLTMTHVMRSLEGHYDISFAKTFYKWDPRQMVVSIHTRDLTRILREYEKRDEPAPIINVIGHHPAFHLGSLAQNPWGVDDYATLGAFLGEPLRLTPSATWGERFMVPADAEMIIEGEIPPGQRDVCDPFGEVARLYQAQCLRPVFDVKAVTFRDGAILQDVFSGFSDSNTLGALWKEASLDGLLRPQFPNLHQIHAPDSGCGVYSAYVSLRDAQPGQAEALGRLALEKLAVLQCVVVVDADVDVFDEGQVMWALHTYPRLDRALHLAGARVAGQPGMKAGFATTNWGAKVTIDATRPTGFAFGLRSEVPPEAIERVRLDKILPRG